MGNYTDTMWIWAKVIYSYIINMPQLQENFHCDKSSNQMQFVFNLSSDA